MQPEHIRTVQQVPKPVCVFWGVGKKSKEEIAKIGLFSRQEKENCNSAALASPNLRHRGKIVELPKEKNDVGPINSAMKFLHF